MAEGEVGKFWMAVYTKPRNEKKVAQRLDKAGIENYLPLREQLHRWSDRMKKVKVPVISSYVFVKVCDSDRYKVLQDPGISNFVFWLGKPALIRDEEISRIKYLLKEADATDEVYVEQILPGEVAQISGGQFAGESVVVESAGKKEYTVFLTGLGVKLRLSKLNLSRVPNLKSV